MTADGGDLIIEGVGLVSPLGLGAWPTFRSLLNGRCLTDRLRGPIASGDVDTPVGVVEAAGAVGVASGAADDPAAELIERAVREAVGLGIYVGLPCVQRTRREEGVMHTAGPSGRAAGDELGPSPCGQPGPVGDLPIFLGTSKGAIHAAARAAVMWERHGQISESLAEAFGLGPGGYLSRRVSVRLGLPVAGHDVAACASSLVALHRASRWLMSRPVDSPQRRAIVATGEAALLPALVYSYRRLGVLAPLTSGQYRGRPLDERRSGFVLSHLAAAVLLRRLAPGEAATVRASAVTADGCEVYDLPPTTPGRSGFSRRPSPAMRPT